MAINSTVAGYTNIGHDLQVSFTGNGGAFDGVSLTIPNVMAFEWRERTTDINHMRMNGRTLVADLPRSWEGSIEFHRGDNSAEAAFSLVQENWFGLVDFVLGTIVCTVTSGQETSKFTFLDVSGRLEEGGRWRGDEVTVCRIAFQAAQLVA